MKVVGRDVLHTFGRRHADARGPVENWLAEVERARWSNTQSIKNRYPSASFLHGNVVIFNLKGHSYRLVVTIALRAGVVIVQWIGTHREYDSRNKRLGDDAWSFES